MSHLSPQTRVTITRSTHPDAPAGTPGTIVGVLPYGYTVEVTANFYQVSGGHKVETRAICVEFDAVKQVD